MAHPSPAVHNKSRLKLFFQTASKLFGIQEGWGFIFNNIFKQVKCKKSVDT